MIVEVIFIVLVGMASLLTGFMFGHRSGVNYAARFERGAARKLVWQVVRENIENPSIPRDQAAAIRRACMTVIDQLSD